MSFKKIIEHLNITEQRKSSLFKNKRAKQNLENLFSNYEFSSNDEIQKSASELFLHFATRMPNKNISNTDKNLLINSILSCKLKHVDQVEAACKYIEKNLSINQTEFESFCGVGVVISDEEINQNIDEILQPHMTELKENKWEIFPRMRSSLMKQLRTSTPWADGRRRLELFDEKTMSIIGPKPAKDSKKAKNKPISNGKSNAQNKPKQEEIKGVVGIDKFLTGREMPIIFNSAETYAEHLKRTNNVFRTRFPPEPNGYLHIGHAKAMNFNFSLAKVKKGSCILRYDDTNPLTEETDYIESIKDNVYWLGHEPVKITYSSDYYEDLYALAIKMIRKGYAYVCHQTKAEIKEARETKRKTNKASPSPYRNRAIEENLRLFEKMRNGEFAPGEATLRMKGDINHNNANMWDHVAYRIIDAEHPRTGSKWRIYPTYDFTHCTVDSLEDIDASCCTLEFENRRESYFWLLDVLDLYKPVVWEFSRLNMEYNVMSKRMLSTLVEEKLVIGWDDPRLFTINGMRRRGIPASAINHFCDKIGVTRAENYISPMFLNFCVRDELNESTKRVLSVLEPLKIIITNFEDDHFEEVNCPYFPSLGIEGIEGGHYVHPLRKVVYIERKDFRENDSKKFYGLAPGKSIRLKYSVFLTCEEVVKDGTGEITHLLCRSDRNQRKLKGVLHWVSKERTNNVEVRLFKNLFTAKRPGAEGKNWLEDFNKNSIKILKNAMIADSVVEECKEWKGEKWDKRFQFERLGYFCMDKESDEKRLIFNRILSLKESKGKIS